LGFSPKERYGKTSMRTVMAFPRCALSGALLGTAALLCSSALICTPALQAQEIAPSVRIVNRIDERNLVKLKGNTHPAAKAKNDRGLVSADLPMTDLILVLSRSPQQLAAFEKVVASEYDSSSPNFHQWLTPEEIGQKYGPSETDIASISQWLGGHGFTVDEVPNDRMTIRFSGTASMVESTFHTEIHNLDVKGVAHIANMSDPLIPAALTPVVVGVKALHNFFPRPQHELGSQVERDSKTGKWKRVASEAAMPATVRTQYTTQDSYGDLLEDVGPYDFATIYNVLPLWNASMPVTGNGQTIAIAGTSDINMPDVTSFRSTFGLPAYTTNAPIQQVVHGPDPGDCANDSSTCADDLIENSLDVEWSGSIAPAAQIFLAVSGSNSASDDTVWDSSSYVINNKNTVNASILNVSYGECELFEGVAGNLSYYNLWQTAYASGIAVFVAAGDSGSASCDQGGDQEYGVPYGAEYGLSVSGLASTPYNTAVGGTDLMWCPMTSMLSSSCFASAAQYWNTTNSSTNSNALGYIPEIPWNNTCAGAFGAEYLTWISGYTHYGTVTDAESACNFVLNYATVIYDNYGVDLSGFVDTVGGGGGASGCIVSDANSDVSSCGSATTTGVTYGNSPLHNGGWIKPIWQTGVEGIPQDGVRDIPDVSFFASNGFLGSAYLICVSAISSCSYSNPTALLAQEVGGTSVATPAMAGVMALINQKSESIQGNPNTQFYKLAAMQSYSSCSAETVTSSSSCYFNDIDADNTIFENNFFTNNNAVPCDNGGLGNKSPNCYDLNLYDTIGILGAGVGNPGYSAVTGYDLATGLGSLNVANVVNSFVSIGSHPDLVTVSPALSSITANQSLNVTITVASAYTGGGTPTGTVTLSGGGYDSPTETLNASGVYTYTIPGNTLSAGAGIVLTASYSGDGTYASESNTATVSVTQLTPGMAVSAPGTANSNYPLTVTVTMSGTGGTPAGTVTLSAPGYTSAAKQVNASGVATIIVPADTFTTTESVTLSAKYSGDPTYISDVGTASVAVTYVPVLTPQMTVIPQLNYIDSDTALNVTATVTGASTAESSPTGTVTLTASLQGSGIVGYTSSAEPLVGGVYVFTIPANTLSVQSGIYVLTVSYSGDPIYDSMSSSAQESVGVTAFTLTAPATEPTISAPGGDTTVTILVNTTAGYTGEAIFSATACQMTSGPANESHDIPTCTLPSGSISMGTGMGSTMNFTVSTIPASSAALAYTKLPGKGWAGAGGGAVLALLLFLGMPARRRSWRSMLGLLLLMAALGSFSACGGGSSASSGGGGMGDPGTTPGTYLFTVTATGDPTVAPTPSVSFSVLVN
jgi:hypothetical protein